jgi:hypothetical protein
LVPNTVQDQNTRTKEKLDAGRGTHCGNNLSLGEAANVNKC